MYQHQGWWFPDEESHFPKMLDKNVAKGGQPVYQEPVRQRSISLTKNKRLELDIGANVGLFSLYMLNRGAKNVHSFEPTTKAYDQLNNLLKNDSRVKLHKLAIYNI